MPGPAASRVGDAIATGHWCDTVSKIAGPGNIRVLIGGKPAAVVGDLSDPHTHGVPPICISHTEPITTGYKRVLVGSKSIAMVGSLIDSGAVTGGADRVFVSNPENVVPVVPETDEV